MSIIGARFTIDVKLYYQQLENLKAALQGNRRERRKVLLVDDNTRAHRGKVTERPKAGRIRMGGVLPLRILVRSASLRLSSVPFAPQSYGNKARRR